MTINNKISFKGNIIQTDLRRLVNQIWKLLPMRENKEDWLKQLNSVLNELYGLHEMFGDQLQLLILLSRLEGLKTEPDFMTYRVTVFNCISSLIEEINKINE